GRGRAARCRPRATGEGNRQGRDQRGDDVPRAIHDSPQRVAPGLPEGASAFTLPVVPSKLVESEGSKTSQIPDTKESWISSTSWPATLFSLRPTTFTLRSVTR